MNEADFAISRSGASTLWELCAIGLPTLFIPYPYAASNHQYYNAEFLTKQGVSFVALQEDVTDTLIKNILQCDLQYQSMQMIHKDGVKKIVDTILT